MRIDSDQQPGPPPTGNGAPSRGNEGPFVEVSWADLGDSDDDDDEAEYDDGQLTTAWGLETLHPDVLADLENRPGNSADDFLAHFDDNELGNESGHGWQIIEADEY